MKKIFLLLSFFLICAISYSQQYPVTQNLGAPKTLVVTKGGIQVDSSLILPHFPDTASANISTFIKKYPGTLIRVGDSLYVRSADTTTWLPLNSGNVNIINNFFTYNTRLISGSAVWDSLLIYSVTKCIYYINGNLYGSAATNVTLAAADSSNPRIDVIYCDTSGNVGVITGVSSPDPVKPVVNPLSQIELTHIDVNAQATTPAGISKKIIYNENTGLPGEWTTSSTSGAITFNYATNPYKDLVSAFFDGGAALNQSAIFTNNANVNADTLSLLSMYLRLNSAVASISKTLLAIQLFKSGVLVSTTIQVESGRYGYNENILSAYQQLAIPFSDFTFRNPTDKTFDQIRIIAYDVVKLGFQIDYITAQVGGNPPPVTSNYWSLSGNDISASPTSVLGTTSKNPLSIVTLGVEAINIAEDGIIRLPRIFSNTDTTTYKPLAINTNDGELVRMDSWIGGGTGSVTAVTGVAPVFSSGGTTPSISMSIASTSTNGYLTQGDWNIFNNKLNPADTISLSTRVNNAYNSVTRLSDTSFYLKKPNDVKDTILLGNSIVYAENPIMARVSNDSNIIYFNPDTANVWRGGSGTIPTLQQVLDNNHNLVNNNNFQGTLAGTAQTGNNVNAFGNSAGEFNTGIWVNAFGNAAAETNVGNQVNAFGIAAGQDNSGSDVNFLGNLAGNANSGGSVNGLGLYAAKDNTGNNVNAFGYNTGVGNTANDINLFGKNASATANNQIVYTTDDGTYQTRLQQNNTQDNLINIPNESGTLLLDAPADGNLYGRQNNAWAIVSGGSGTVTSISQGYGITNSPNPIIATGTITVDTATLSGKYVRITDTANMLSPYPIGSGAATTVAFWDGTRSLTNNSQIAIDNSSPTSPSLQIRASTVTTRSFMNPTYSGVQYNATNYAINNISTTTPLFINHEEIINRESRLYSNSLQFSNLSTSGYVTLSPPTSFNNRNYTLPDSSGTIALNEYTVNSISRTPGKDSIIFYVGSTRYAIKDSVGTATGFVPYTGATTDVDLGTHILSAQGLRVTGTNGAGDLHLRHQATDATATGQSTALFADANGDLKYKNAGNFYTTLKTSGNAADAIYTYPSATTTLIGAADTSVLQRKNIAAYSLQANNTASAANVTTQTYRDVAEAAISGTITWTSGTAPTTLISANYQWQQIGKVVTVQVSLLYTNPSTLISAFTFPLPSDMPLPVTPTGWSAASSYLFTGSASSHATTSSLSTSALASFIRRDAANTGYEIGGGGALSSARGWKINLTYKAQ